MKPSLTRRAFVQSAAALSLSAGLPAVAPATTLLKPPCIDTHIHCFAGTQDERFPYHANGPYKPEDAATPEKLLGEMNRCGVDGVVIVHPEPYLDDHRYLEHCLTVGGNRFKGTALVFADQPKSVAQLPDLVKKLPIVAVRVHAYAPERLPPFDKPELRQLWKLASDLGIAVQLHFEPRYAPRFTHLIKEFKNTTVVIDHLGRPLQGTAEEHAVVVKWADFDNCVMKLSSLPPTRMYPHRDVKPVVKQLLTAYGVDRLICGGGKYEVSGRTASVFSYLSEYLGDINIDDWNKINGLNAKRLFKFEV